LFFYQNSKNLKLIPQGRLQAALELLYEGLDGFIIGIIGAAGKIYVPFVGTIFIFILTMNWVGLIPGFMSPTSNLNVTVTMAVTTVLLVQLISIKELGLKDYLLHLCGEPLWLAPLMFPIHLVGELVAKPMSLAFRLFGNVFGEDQVIINLAALGLGIMLATWVPIPLQFPLLAFAVFTSFVQAFVFALLTAIYIVLFIGEHDAHHGEHHGEAH